MADSKESFEILENSAGDGVSPSSAQIGDAGGGKIGMAVFPFRDASGNLRMPEVNASNILKTDGSSVTQPISAASLPLPTGAATSANQTTANTSLASIDAGIPAGLGQTTMSASMPVVIASDQSNVPAGISVTNNYTPTIPYTEVSVGKLKADPDGQLLIRGDVLTDEGTFRDDFTGSNISNQRWTSASTGNSTISVSNSFVTINSGTGTNNRVSITAIGDYGPISFRSQFSLSQRIANQECRFGFADNTASPAIYAFFKFTGTDNTLVICESSSSIAAVDTQTTTVKIPNGTSATSNDYYIEVQPDQVTFVLNGFQVAQHRIHIPGPYDALNISCIIQNSGVVTATSAAIDYIYFINQNSLQVNNSFTGDDLPVRPKTGFVQTYGAAITALTVANTPTDIFTITGSATKAVKIKHISMNGTQTTAGNINLLLIKRSTANTAGTSTTLTAVPFDSLNAAATATVRAYTANPTLGTTVGALHNEKLFVPTVTTVGDEFVFNPTSNSNAQEITLRGVNEVLAINLNSTTVTGNNFNVDITWTEE